MIIINEKECLVKVEGLIEGWKPAKTIDELRAYSGIPDSGISAGFVWKGAKVPASLVADALALIKKYPFEVALALYYNPDTQDWKGYAPKQSGSGAYVKYDGIDEEIPEGYYFTGTIHSHPRMGAFWSSTDTNDQNGKAGIHMVVGTNANGDMTSNKQSIFFGGAFYDYPCFELPDKPSDVPPAEWVKVIDEQALKNVPASIPVYKPSSAPANYKYTPYSPVDDWLDMYDDYPALRSYRENNLNDKDYRYPYDSCPGVGYRHVDDLILDTLQDICIYDKDGKLDDICDAISAVAPHYSDHDGKSGVEMDELDRNVIKALAARYYPELAEDIADLVDEQSTYWVSRDTDTVDTLETSPDDMITLQEDPEEEELDHILDIKEKS